MSAAWWQWTSRASLDNVSCTILLLFPNLFYLIDISLDCFGISRNIYNWPYFPLTMEDPAGAFSLCLFHCTNTQGAVDFNSGNALAIVELNSMNYKLSVLGLPPYEGPPLDLTKAPYQVFVSSPNMDYIPNFSLNIQYVFICKNS